jgi:hypothetical protein
VGNNATYHIIGNLDKLIMNENCGGQDQVHVANDAGMKIKHIGRSTIFIPSGSIHLENVTHVPKAK